MVAGEARAEVVLLSDGEELARWPLLCSGPPDLAVVDRLARLQLAAKREGCSIWLRDACPELLALIELVGLGDVVAVGRRPPGCR